MNATKIKILNAFTYRTLCSQKQTTFNKAFPPNCCLVYAKFNWLIGQSIPKAIKLNLFNLQNTFKSI